MRRKALAASALIFTVTAAYADGPTVFQENRKFSESEITVKQGQTVMFTNHDTVTHNVYSKTPGLAFDLRTQKVGESSEIKFDNVGVADVQCAIHPQMKMKVTVVP